MLILLNPWTNCQGTETPVSSRKNMMVSSHVGGKKIGFFFPVSMTLANHFITMNLTLPQAWNEEGTNSYFTELWILND